MGRGERTFMNQPDEEAFHARYPLSHQCQAKSKQTGRRCQSPVIPGGVTCRAHGGSTKAARNKAQLRLLELVDPAITVLAREMATAERSADRQRAANSILDRAGVPRSPAAPDAEFARAALVERLLAMRASAVQEIEGHPPDGPHHHATWTTDRASGG